jgi:hypothetical protein
MLGHARPIGGYLLGIVSKATANRQVRANYLSADPGGHRKREHSVSDGGRIGRVDSWLRKVNRSQAAQRRTQPKEETTLNHAPGHIRTQFEVRKHEGRRRAMVARTHP